MKGLNFRASLLLGAAPLPTHCHKSVALGAVIFWHQVISNPFFFLSNFPFLTPRKKSLIKVILLKLGDLCPQFWLVPWAQSRTMLDENSPPGWQFPAHGDTKISLIQIPKCAQPPAPTGTAGVASWGGGQGGDSDPLEDWGVVEAVVWGLRRRGTRDEQGWGEAAVGWQAERSPGGEGKPRLVHLIDLVSERSLSCKQNRNLRNFPEVVAADQSVPNLVKQARDCRVKSEPSACPKQRCGYVDASLLRKLNFSIFFSSAPEWLRELLLQRLLLVQNTTACCNKFSL